MNFRLFYLSLALFFGCTLTAQEDFPKILFLEHFTNTECPICASQNPGFYETIDDFPGSFIHLSYHPDIPYEECQFYQYNKSGNTARSDFYTLNGTPTVFLNGGDGAPVREIDQEDLMPFLDQRSFAQLEVDLSKSVPFEANVTVETASGYDPADNRLYVLLAEEVVHYQAPNGEDVHRDVFRRFLTSDQGDALQIAPGEEESMSFTYEWDDTWVEGELYAIAFIQNDSSGQIVNVSSSLQEATATEEAAGLKPFKIFPSPTEQSIQIEAPDQGGQLMIYDMNGRLKFQTEIQDVETDSVDVSSLGDGAYLALFTGDSGQYYSSFIKN